MGSQFKPQDTSRPDLQATAAKALDFLRVVKAIFQDERWKYEEFLEVMKDYRLRRIDTKEVMMKVLEMFKGHTDLIHGFNIFLPKEYQIKFLEEWDLNDFSEAHDFVYKIKNRLNDDMHSYQRFIDILNMHRLGIKSIHEVYQEVAILFHNQPDLLEEFISFLPNHGMMVPQHLSSYRAFLRQDEKTSVVRTIKHEPREKRDVTYNAHADHDLSVDRPYTQRGRQRRRTEKDARVNIDPEHLEKGLEHDSKGLDGVQRKHKLTRKLDDPGTKRLHQNVEGVENHAIHCISASSYDDKNALNRTLTKPVKVENRGTPMQHETDERDKDREREMDKERDVLDNDAPFSSKDVASQKPPLFSSKEKHNQSKPVSELDLSNCRSCTPSYRLLPENYQIPQVSYKTKLDASVLNDVWVSVTSGSEDYSVKHMQKNQYEESLFKCEDDRFEFDVLLESMNNTISHVEKLLENMQDSTTIAESSIQIEDHIPSLNLRFIERIYGDHGLDVMESLLHDPAQILPVVLKRLKKKQEEWSRCRSVFNKAWAEIFAMNYHKSLDHEIFNFKQQDLKSLSAKALLAEIKEICNKKQEEDDVLVAITTGNRPPLVPHMEFQYEDSDIHEDLYQIIKFSCGEVFTSPDQVVQAMNLWTTFLEPLLGVPPRPYDAEVSGDAAETKSPAVKNSLASMGECNRSPIADGSVANAKQGNVGDGIPPEQTNTCRVRFADWEQTEAISGVCGAPMSMETVPGSLLSSEVLPSLEGGGMARVSVNGDCTPKTTKILKYYGSPASSNNSRMELEEGEVLPNEDFAEDYFMGSKDVAIDAVKVNNISARRQYQIRLGEAEASCGEVASENDDDDDEGDESAQRSLEDSENESKAGEDYSGSESGEGEGCSREDHKDQYKDADNDDRDAKAESKCEAEGKAYAHDAEGEMPSSERFLHTVKPLAKHVAAALSDEEDNGSRIFYGSDSFYVLLRLHQALYERVLSTKTNSSKPERKWRLSKNTSHSDQYAKFISALYNLLDGTNDYAKYEEDCRAIIGTQCYVLFTLDKLIYKVVKQLQAIALDEKDNKLLQLYMYEKSRRTGKFRDLVYNDNAHVLLHDKSVYRFECCSNRTRLSIQLMDCVQEEPEVEANFTHPIFSDYVYNDFLSNVSEKEVPGIFMTRNKLKNWSGDEYPTCKAVEGVQIVNGLDYRISCSSSKVSYVLDTEDKLVRVKKRKYSNGEPTSCSDQAYFAKLNDVRVHRFHKFLSK